ncbi:fimbrial protein [Citrobacter meridianamericanus]|uniref:F4 family fimbrial subunit n=1 Tax=Citrobacter meridianamericanus TaxID=2894201 RepID=UPI00351CC0FA
MKLTAIIKKKSNFSVPPISLILLIASLLPTAVLATWNSPGRDFYGELMLDGKVTSIRNPWLWQVDRTHINIQVKAVDRYSRDGEQVWKGLMVDGPLLLGKTVLTTPTGREGLAPVVSFGVGQEGFNITPKGKGVVEVMLPVYTSQRTDNSEGSLNFLLETAALIRHVVNGNAIYSGLYNDLYGNGLPGKGQEMAADITMKTLCGMFTGEGPTWLCDASLNVTENVPISYFTNSDLFQVEGVYGAMVIGRSGTLKINGSNTPASWKATFPVRIEYR